MSLEKDQENTSVKSGTTHEVTTTKSKDELYQGRTSSTADSQDNVATLDNNSINNDKLQETNNGSYFKSKKEKLEFSILMVGIILSMFMMSLNSTVVAPAMSIIATELNALESQTWIATAYLVSLNSFQPLSGRVSNR